jgi:hypothetical protein
MPPLDENLHFMAVEIKIAVLQSSQQILMLGRRYHNLL